MQVGREDGQNREKKEREREVRFKERESRVGHEK